jgi:tetratricopeptide (TPR) repeat protein
VELAYASSSLWNGVLTEERLAVADRFVKAERDRRDLRYLLSLRGEWHLAKGQWSLAAESLQEAVRMAREVGLSNADAETQLALARLHLGQLPDARREAEQLARAKVPAHGTLAELWLGIGDPDEAEKHAVLAYKCAWGDGEPYVFRYELNKARALLENLGAAAPKLPHYDPAKDERFPWEDEVAAAIEGLRAKRS